MALPARRPDGALVHVGAAGDAAGGAKRVEARRALAVVPGKGGSDEGENNSNSTGNRTYNTTTCTTATAATAATAATITATEVI